MFIGPMIASLAATSAAVAGAAAARDDSHPRRPAPAPEPIGPKRRDWAGALGWVAIFAIDLAPFGLLVWAIWLIMDGVLKAHQ